MKKISFALAMLCMAVAVYAADGNYNVALIHPELRKEANAVKRSEEIVFELLSEGKARLYRKYAITVLNENGERFASMVEYYHKFRSIRSIDGTLYDANGKKIRSLKKTEIEDHTGGGDDGTMVDDFRFKVHTFYHKVYPYTVEYEVELQYTGTLFFPDWQPHQGQRFAVQQSKFTVICPGDYKLRYKPMNTKVEPVIADKGSKKNYSWELVNLAPIESEYASKSWTDLCPQVIIGASDFKMENYTGNMETWQDFGKFVYSLKQGKDQLPDNIKKKVAELTTGVTDTRQKVNALYEFMQSNTRYIGIQLGIGGWQPFDATYVATKRYGDCKALSNYMYSLLKEAGINSYYTLIRADEDDKSIMTDFPSSQFNHVIICVPVEKDTIWLECTSQTVPAGYLGFSTYDRPVLLIDENGGKMVRTRNYSMKDNVQLRRINATVDPEGNLNANIKTTYSGLQQEYLHGMIHALSKEKVMEYLKKNIDLATYDVSKFDYKQHKAALPVLDESLDLTVAHYASVSGKRIFIQPNILTRQSTKLTTDKERKYPITMNYEYTDVDTVHLQLPAGYKPEAMPQDVEVTSIFGKYTSKVRLNGNELTYYRAIEKRSGEYPPSAWPELVKFYEQVYKADRAKVVLVKE